MELKEYELDLKILQGDLASKGLSISSTRTGQEGWLKEECDSEIEMKESESEEYEKERNDRRVERLVFVITNITLAVVPLYSLYKS